MKKVLLLAMTALCVTNANAQTTIEQPQPKKVRQLPQVVLKANAGYGWRTADIYEEFNDYMKDFITHLKSGFAWDASCDYFWHDKLGVRAIFYQYRASHSDFAQNLDTWEYGTLTIKDQINYFGPAFVFRQPFRDNTFIFDAHGGFGYMEYKSNLTFVSDKIKMNGSTLGAQMGAGLECRVIPQLGIGINMQMTIGTITIFHYETNGEKTTETSEDKAEGLAQIKIGAGIRYYIK